MMRRGVFRGRLLIRGAIERSLSTYALEMDLWKRLAVLPDVAPPPDARYAVLVPIYVDSYGTNRIIFTRRPEHMRTHPGDVVFPGGGREEEKTRSRQRSARRGRKSGSRLRTLLRSPAGSRP